MEEGGVRRGGGWRGVEKIICIENGPCQKYDCHMSARSD